MANDPDVVNYLAKQDDFLHRYIVRTIKYIRLDMTTDEVLSAGQYQVLSDYRDYNDRALDIALFRHIMWYLNTVKSDVDPYHYLWGKDYREFAREILAHEDHLDDELSDAMTEIGVAGEDLVSTDVEDNFYQSELGLEYDDDGWATDKDIELLLGHRRYSGPRISENAKGS